MERREFLRTAGQVAMMLAAPTPQASEAIAGQATGRPQDVALFLCGDVMTGRGIDQILAHPSSPELHEPYVKHAGRYVELAEAVNGPIRRRAPATAIWGDALQEIDRRAPHARIVNLETAVTRSDEYDRGKGIHYRMHPENVSCLTAARIDCCTLANNHVLDWGHSGLAETIETLSRAGIQTAGAGRNRREAETPAILPVSGTGRVIVMAVGAVTSGIPVEWAAGTQRPGVNAAARLSNETVSHMAGLVRQVKEPGDLAVVSIHWGPNWGYEVPREHRRFAHQLIDVAGVDVVHGHSSHHPLGIEVYRGRPILYGCGDFLNDYEGISGYEEFRSHLALAYFVRMNPRTGLLSLVATPFQMKQFTLRRSSRADAGWLRDTLSREGRTLGTAVELGEDGTLQLRWS
jgi:poly-gamma-glutamate synthesis protein (capsule biosynthesis protein)